MSSGKKSKLLTKLHPVGEEGSDGGKGKAAPVATTTQNQKQARLKKSANRKYGRPNQTSATQA